jgi:Tfp pilus assembly protein PilF
MRIPFKNLGQAELYLKTCLDHLNRHLNSTSPVRLPTQRVKNAFCRGFGYSSYDELKRVLSTGPRDSKTIPSEREFKEVFTRAFLLAIEVAYQSGLEEDVTHQYMVLMLADGAVEELKRVGSALELYRQSPAEESEERADRGWELVENGRLVEAVSEFSRAVALDGDFADAYNGLGYVSFARGDYEGARRHSQTALEKARQALGSDAPDAYTWYGELKTRPYMRARHTLGLSLMKLGDLQGAVREFKELLRRNANDNQGVRFLVGPLYHQLGDLRHAIPAYRSSAAKGDRTGEPHNEINYALALYEAGKYEESVLRFRYGTFRNLHIPQAILGLPVRRLGIWYGSNEAEPEYALNYKEEYGSLWEGKAGALSFLRRVYAHTVVQAEINEFVSLRARLNKVHDFDQRSPIVDEVFRLEALWRLKGNNKSITEEVAARVL